MSTIYALATPPGRAGLAVIRVSGPDAFAAVERLSGPLPSPRHAGLRTLRTPDGSILDEAIVLTFPEGGSYTGERVAELQCHGAPTVVDAVLAALGSLRDLRAAEPGEFTRRALLKGRMSLAQVEGLSDLLAAETELQRKQAQALYGGAVETLVRRWQADLRRALALIEATIDFADQDVPSEVREQVTAIAERVRSEIDSHLAGIRPAERIREGFEVAVIGPPNSGKSTLINYLSGRETALVTDQAGTTRDVIEVHLDLGGLPVTFLDTAGLREAEDRVEALGIERARRRAAAADLRVLLLDDPDDALPWSDDDMTITVMGKADLRGSHHGISGQTGQGVECLMNGVRDRLRRLSTGASVFNRHRHREALNEAGASLHWSHDAAELLDDVVADGLWRADRNLGRITGQTGIEDVLGDVFSSFCIGK